MPALTRSGLPPTPSPNGRLGRALLAPQPTAHQRRQAARYADVHKAVIHVQYVPRRGWRVLKPDAPRVPYSMVQQHLAERAAYNKALGLDGKDYEPSQDTYQYIQDPESNMYFKVPYDASAAQTALENKLDDERRHPYDPRTLLQRLFQDGGGYFVAADTVVKWATLGTVIVYGIVGAALVLTESATLAVLLKIASAVNSFVMLSEITISAYFEAIASQVATVLRLGPLARIILSAPILRSFFRSAEDEIDEGGIEPWARTGGGTSALKPSGMNPGILSGHGEWQTRNGVTIVPEGTSVTVYTGVGRGITDKLGQAIETGQDYDLTAFNQYGRMSGARTYLPGAEIPNYTLKPPFNPDLTIMNHSFYGAPSTVSAPTTLDQLLRPGMGNVKWAACCVISH